MDVQSTKPSGPASILVVEDDQGLRSLVTLILSREGHILTGAESVAKARHALSLDDVDLVLLDNTLPDGTANDVLDLVGTTPVVLLSGAPPEVAPAPVVAVLLKPVSAQDLRAAVALALGSDRAKKARDAGGW